VLIPAVIVAVAASCGADHPSANERRSIAIYAAVIRAVVAQPTTAPAVTTTATTIRTVFVTAADDRSPISLEVQAGIVQALHQVLTIRFVDQRSEAIDRSDPHQPVHEGAVLVTLGKIPTGHNQVTVKAQRYQRVDIFATYSIKVHRTGATWTA
jgi:hypothetical protein